MVEACQCGSLFFLTVRWHPEAAGTLPSLQACCKPQRFHQSPQPESLGPLSTVSPLSLLPAHSVLGTGVKAMVAFSTSCSETQDWRDRCSHFGQPLRSRRTSHNDQSPSQVKVKLGFFIFSLCAELGRSLMSTSSCHQEARVQCPCEGAKAPAHWKFSLLVVRSQQRAGSMYHAYPYPVTRCSECTGKANASVSWS